MHIFSSLIINEKILKEICDTKIYNCAEIYKIDFFFYTEIYYIGLMYLNINTKMYVPK